MQGTFTILCCLWCQPSLLFYKTFAMIIFLSQMFCSLFLYGIIDWVFKNIPIGNREGVRWVAVCMQWGVIASIHVHMMGGGGSNFGHFGVYVLIE